MKIIIVENKESYPEDWRDMELEVVGIKLNQVGQVGEDNSILAQIEVKTGQYVNWYDAQCVNWYEELPLSDLLIEEFDRLPSYHPSLVTTEFSRFKRLRGDHGFLPIVKVKV